MEFLDFVLADDGEGGFNRTSNVEITVYGAVRPANAREIDAAGRLQQRLSHIGMIRWRPDFRPKQGQAVRWIDRRGATRTAYVNTARDPDERGQFMELQLREGGPTGGAS